jgi:site-specific DNA recombinase
LLGPTSTLIHILNKKTELMSVIGDQKLTAATISHSLNCAHQLAEMIQQSSSQESRNLIESFVARISIASDRLIIQTRRDSLLQMMKAAHSDPAVIHPDAVFHEISASLTLRRRCVEAKLIFDSNEYNKVFDPLLVSTVANAHTWFKALVSQRAPSINEIALEHGIPASEVSRLLPLAFLAPDIVKTITAGKQPIELTTKFLTRFRDLPLDWDQQRKALGFPISTDR